MIVKDIRPALYSFLMDDLNISSIVGGARIYPVKLLQGVIDPSIVYNRISGQGDHHSEGPSGLTRPRIQIDCYATTHDQAVSLADKVKTRLDGYKGVMGLGQTAVNVQGVFFDSDRDDFDPDQKLYRVSRDYIIWFEER